jgi:hypothetical protein
MTSIVKIRTAAHTLDTTLRMHEVAERLLDLLETTGALEELHELGPTLREELAHRVVAAAVISVLRPARPPQQAVLVPERARGEPQPAPPGPLVYGKAAQDWTQPATPERSTSYWNTLPQKAAPYEALPNQGYVAPQPATITERPRRRQPFWDKINELAFESRADDVKSILHRAIRGGSIDKQTAVEVALFADPNFEYGDVIQTTADERHIARIAIGPSRHPVLDIVITDINATSTTPMTTKDIDDMTRELLTATSRRGETVDRNISDECLRWAKERWRQLSGTEHRRGTFRRGN